MGRLTFSRLEAERLSENHGVVRGQWKLEFASTDPQVGLFTLLLRRLPEGWRIVHDHTSIGAPRGG
jgi:beta-aspartyl-peptidase (threonine type)